jgi:hypothetical protein
MAADEVLLVAEHDGCHFEIQEGRGEGYYVWRFVGASNRSTHDYLQDDLAIGCRGTVTYFVIKTWSLHGTAPSSQGETASLPEESRSFHGGRRSFQGETLSSPEKTPSFHGGKLSLPEKTPSFQGETPSLPEKSRSFHGGTASFPEKKPAFHGATGTRHGMLPPRRNAGAPENRSEQFGVVAFPGLRLRRMLKGPNLLLGGHVNLLAGVNPAQSCRSRCVPVRRHSHSRTRQHSKD